MNEIQQLTERITYLEGVIANLMKTGQYTFRKDVVFFDGIEIRGGKNIALDTTTGTKIGTSTTQKLAFFNATPIVQEVTAPSTVAGVNYIFRQYGLLAP